MLRKLRRHRPSPNNRLVAPAIIGLIGLISTPTVTAFADVTAYISAAQSDQGRWKSHLTASPAGAIQEANLVFTDPILTGSIRTDAGITLANGDRIAFTGKVGNNDPRPDSERVTRSLKKGRVIAVAPVQPPKDFSAGSVVQRQSSLLPSLLRPVMNLEKPMKFLEPTIRGEEISIATAFYRLKPKGPDPQVPAALAGLVTNREADILATAYAPPQPDYARQSPFASILRKDDKRGRFIPPIGEDDHAWAATPLPPVAFSESEQRCLAAGIYFEARGESVKGQAAVAQVILNRVRNPAYPDTICGVVYQNESWRNRCQFSFACDGIKDRVKSRKHWDMAEEIALATTAGKIWFKEVGAATHYHAAYVHPRWARNMRKVGRIGLHIFYETYGGGWS